MDKDYVALEFSGRNLAEVCVKMVEFLNTIRGINLVNVPEAQQNGQADSEGLLQGERPGVSEGTPGGNGGAKKDTK